MNFSDIRPIHLRKPGVRVGRGGKRGKTSGKGTKGQRAHGSHGIRAHIRDELRRLPKLRGRGMNLNKPIGLAIISVNLSVIARNTVAGDLINKQFLIDKNIISRNQIKQYGVKILGFGTLSHKIIVAGIPVSAGARTAIEAVGGTIE